MGVRKTVVLLVLLMLPLAVLPTTGCTDVADAGCTFVPNHIADGMPEGNLTLVIRDGAGAHLCTLLVTFSFYKAWHDSVETTGLKMGFYVHWLSAQVDEIQFDSVVFRWYAEDSGSIMFDYEYDWDFSLSAISIGWSFAGSGTNNIKEPDFPSVQVAGGSIQILDVTFASSLGAAHSGSPSPVFGFNFTKHDSLWESASFEVESGETSTDVESISYKLGDSLPLGFLAAFPRLDVLGGLGVITILFALLVYEALKSQNHRAAP
jgi:hypothetical protein